MVRATEGAGIRSKVLLDQNLTLVAMVMLDFDLIYFCRSGAGVAVAIGCVV